LKTKVEIVAHDASVDFDDAVASLKVHFRTETAGRNLTDLDASAPNVCDCWSNCKLVHAMTTVPQILANTNLCNLWISADP